MWCRHCQQDVPAIASPDEPLVRCAKCQQVLSAGADAQPPVTSDAEGSREPSPPSTVAAPAGKCPPQRCGILDDWELDDDLHEAQRLVESMGIGSAEARHTRVDAQPSTRATFRERRPNRARCQSRSSFVSWLCMSLGLMALVFGGVLIGWSFFTQRSDLWQLGIPFTLGGQAVLILGLVFQLDGLWRSNREATTTLDELDSQLHELRHVTTLLSSTQSSASQSFYVHMAEGASPKLLLADLKGQLDLLATRLAEER